MQVIHMNEIVRQFSQNAIQLSVVLVCAGAFLFAIGWSAVQLARLGQLVIATNITIARELSAIQASLVAPSQQVNIPGVAYTASSAPTAPQKDSAGISQKDGEIYGYDEADMAEQEAIRILRAQKKAEGGMSDEAWEAEIDRVNAAGYKEPD